MTRAAVALACVLAAALPGAAAAQRAAGPAAVRPDGTVRYLAANCATCHGTEGRSDPASGLASLAGMPREQLVARMAAFRDGARPAAVMHQLAKGYSDEQIAQLADYFAGQPAVRGGAAP